MNLQGLVANHLEVSCVDPLQPVLIMNDIYAEYRGHPDFLGMDITDVNMPGGTGDCVLHIAVRRDTLEEVEVLLSAGADINKAGDLKNTPLHFAAMCGRKDMVDYLLRRGAKRNLKNEFGQTPFDVACIGNHEEVVKILE